MVAGDEEVTPWTVPKGTNMDLFGMFFAHSKSFKKDGIILHDAENQNTDFVHWKLMSKEGRDRLKKRNRALTRHRLKKVQAYIVPLHALSTQLSEKGKEDLLKAAEEDKPIPNLDLLDSVKFNTIIMHHKYLAVEVCCNGKQVVFEKDERGAFVLVYNSLKDAKKKKPVNQERPVGSFKHGNEIIIPETVVITIEEVLDKLSKEKETLEYYQLLSNNCQHFTQTVEAIIHAMIKEKMKMPSTVYLIDH